MKSDTVTVFCDIGDVLVDSKALIRDSTEAAAIRCTREGYAIIPSLFQAAYLELDDVTRRPHMNHLFGDREIVAAAQLKIQGSVDLRYTGTFLTYYREHLRALLRPDPEVTHFFQSLSKLHNVNTGIISDGTADDQLEILTRLQIMAFLSPSLILISEDIGSEKDNPGIYLEGLKRAASQPASTFMIGDNLERDIEIPRSLGMRTIYFSKYRSMDTRNRSGAKPDFVCPNFDDAFAVFIDARR